MFRSSLSETNEFPKATPTGLGIQFEEALPSELLCTVCSQALRVPLKTICNHYFCKQCLNVEQGSTTCPTCQTIVSKDNVQPDKEKHRQVQSLPVKCNFSDKNCPWKGILKDLQKHISSCGFRNTKCPICKQPIREKEFTMHVKDCGKKETKPCQYCQQMIKTGGLERHLKTCLKVVTSCPFQCGFVDKTREEIEVHQAVCPNARDMCPFAEMGCAFKGDKKAVQKHISEEPVRHLMMLCDQAADIKSSMDDYTYFYNEGVRRCMELNAKLNNCNRMFGANHIWRINDIAQKTNNAKSDKDRFVFSEAFVSSRHGYKMIASCALFGDGSGRGSHLSVFVTIVRGEFDSTLKWPFDLCVKFILLDQNPVLNDRNDVVYSIDAKQMPQGIQLQRPVGDRNAPFGFSRFFPLNQLQYFIKEDTLFLRFDIFEADHSRITEHKNPVVDTVKTLDEIEPDNHKFDVVRM